MNSHHHETWYAYTSWCEGDFKTTGLLMILTIWFSTFQITVMDPYRCYYCNATNTTERDALSHSREHHPKLELRYKKYELSPSTNSTQNIWTQDNSTVHRCLVNINQTFKTSCLFYGVFNLCQHFEISYSRYANKHYINKFHFWDLHFQI
jgi:hypothetical protein